MRSKSPATTGKKSLPALESAVDGDCFDRSGTLSPLWLCLGIKHLCASPFPNLSCGVRIRPFQPRCLSFGVDGTCLFRSRSHPPSQGTIALAFPSTDRSRSSRCRIDRPRTRHSSGDVKRLQYSRGTASSSPLAFGIIAETMATTSLGSIPIETGCPPSSIAHSS